MFFNCFTTNVFLNLVLVTKDYKGKITETKDTLVNLASTSVGATMLEVEASSPSCSLCVPFSLQPLLFVFPFPFFLNHFLSFPQDFLCNMNVSFVERRYDEVNHDICVTFFGGVTQINWAFWMVGVSLEAVAIVAHILSVRLRGLSQKDVERRQQTDCASRADVYG